jgi:hypothetical protein
MIEAGFVEITLRQGSSFDLWATAYKPTPIGGAA